MKNPLVFENPEGSRSGLRHVPSAEAAGGRGMPGIGAVPVPSRLAHLHSQANHFSKFVAPIRAESISYAAKAP